MVQLRGKRGRADSFRRTVTWLIRPSAHCRANGPVTVTMPVLITVMEVTSWHLARQTRVLLMQDTHRLWLQHTLASVNLPRCQTVRVWVSEWVGPGPDVWARVQLNPPPTKTALASSYPLICPDGKWAYCMRGSLGFVLLNGKLEYSIYSSGVKCRAGFDSC